VNTLGYIAISFLIMIGYSWLLASRHVKESTKKGANRSPEAQAAYAKQVSEFYQKGQNNVKN